MGASQSTQTDMSENQYRMLQRFKEQSKVAQDLANGNKEDIDVTNVPEDAPAVWDAVKIEKLVGLCAIRRKPVNYGNGNSDYSYSSEGLVITDASPHGHIAYLHNFVGDVRQSTLDPRWNDDGWARAPNRMCADMFAMLGRIKEVTAAEKLEE